MRHALWLFVVLAALILAACSDSSNDDDDDSVNTEIGKLNGTYILTLETDECQDFEGEEILGRISIDTGVISGTLDTELVDNQEVSGDVDAAGNTTIVLNATYNNGTISSERKGLGRWSFSGCQGYWTVQLDDGTIKLPSEQVGSGLPHEGTWDVTLTADGECAALTDNTVTFALTVGGGVVSGTAATALGELPVTGTVDDDGNVIMEVLGTEHSGVLNSDETGSGTWDLSTALEGCAGSWTAVQTAKASSGGSIEGTWDVTLTSDAECTALTDNTVTFELTVAGGVVSGSAVTALGALPVTGTVDDDGNVVLEVVGTSNEGVLSLDGTGSGTWDLSGLVGGCAGSWTATQTYSAGGSGSIQGDWSVTLNSDTTCTALTDDTVTFTLSVGEETVSGSAVTSLATLPVTGTVDEEGNVVMEVAGTSNPGTLSTDGTGSGTWDLSGLVTGCAGSWTATK